MLNCIADVNFEVGVSCRTTKGILLKKNTQDPGVDNKPTCLEVRRNGVLVSKSLAKKGKSCDTRKIRLFHGG